MMTFAIRFKIGLSAPRLSDPPPLAVVEPTEVHAPCPLPHITARRHEQSSSLISLDVIGPSTSAVQVLEYYVLVSYLQSTIAVAYAKHRKHVQTRNGDLHLVLDTRPHSPQSLSGL